MKARRTYNESYQRLRDLELLGPENLPIIPERLPQPDDEMLGVRFFRTWLKGPIDLSDLSLPRTFFGRSQISDVSFRNTDLHESNLCWNDFIAVDFSAADLSASDLRSSIYDNIKFVGTNLEHADLRRSTFTACVFTGALMGGTVLTRAQGSTLILSFAQRDQIDWRDEDGAEPDGG